MSTCPCEQASKGILQIFLPVVLVRMIPVQIGKQGDLGREVLDTAVTFINLSDQPFTGGVPCRRKAVIIKKTSTYETGLKALSVENMGDHCRRSRFAVAADNGNQATALSLLRQHLATLEGRDARLTGTPQDWVG